ncbi:MAG: hypothetical protein KGV51_02820 [Moraxellaceae bacterium]|nr:hypothetical protein [Moraxellaceae bacterium]
MKNITSVKAIITPKIKNQLLFVATTTVLAIPSISAHAQLSIYGGSSESVSDSQESYYNANNYNTNSNYYPQNTPTYPSISSQTSNYQNNSYNYRTKYYNDSNQGNDLDRLGGLIEKKASEYQYQGDILDEARHNAQAGIYNVNRFNNSFSNNGFSKSSFSNTFSNTFSNRSFRTSKNYYGTDGSFDSWLNRDGNRVKVNAYRKYLVKHLGASNVPPMNQLLQTAKSWKRCRSEPYSVPPVFYWHNMLPTLRLFASLKKQGIIPYDVQMTSVYRNPRLNKCAKGASGSKHKFNFALDLSSPTMKSSRFKLRQVQDDLCNFWLYQGRYYNLGLGLYSKGTIHIDTSQYRKWGNSYSASSSPCRSASFFQ